MLVIKKWKKADWWIENELLEDGLPCLTSTSARLGSSRKKPKTKTQGLRTLKWPQSKPSHHISLKILIKLILISLKRDEKEKSLQASGQEHLTDQEVGEERRRDKNNKQDKGGRLRPKLVNILIRYILYPSWLVVSVGRLLSIESTGLEQLIPTGKITTKWFIWTFLKEIARAKFQWPSITRLGLNGSGSSCLLSAKTAGERLLELR